MARLFYTKKQKHLKNQNNLENLDEEEAEEAEKILEKALEDSKAYDYGYQTVIIAGERYRYGNDEDEIIIENAEVIGIA